MGFMKSKIGLVRAGNEYTRVSQCNHERGLKNIDPSQSRVGSFVDSWLHGISE